MRISDWSSDVCSYDLLGVGTDARQHRLRRRDVLLGDAVDALDAILAAVDGQRPRLRRAVGRRDLQGRRLRRVAAEAKDEAAVGGGAQRLAVQRRGRARHALTEPQAALHEGPLQRQLRSLRRGTRRKDRPDDGRLGTGWGRTFMYRVAPN